MILKSLLTITLCVVLLNLSHAQQDPLYSQYMFNMLSINPAYAGSRDVLSATLIYRRQWVNVEGAPVTQMLSVDFPTASKKVGIGFQILNDKIGINQTTGVYGTYAYRIRLRKGILAMGVQGGFTRYYANYSGVQVSGSSADPVFAQNLNDYQPNVGAGVYYSTHRFYIGFSSPHILGRGTFYSASNGKDIARENAHWLLAAGYVMNLSDVVALKPSLLLRMVQGSPIHADFNANLWFYNTISIGASVRTSQTVVAMAELQLNRQLRVGYSYDWNTGSLRSQGSHEIMLRYEFGYEKKRMTTPRFF